MVPTLDRVDHIHVFVTDRAASERWYAEVMGLVRIPELEFWASDGGPLTIGNSSGAIHLALFERAAQPCRSTVAFSVSADSFLAWLRHLKSTLRQPVKVQDHDIVWSLYFADPDGNPFEITSYDYEALSLHLRPGG